MKYISRKQLLLTSTVLLIVMMVAVSSAFVYGLGGQNKNSNQKAKDEEFTAKSATVRESNKKLRAKEGFEFVQEGKNKVSVRRHGSQIKGNGSISCFCFEKDNTIGFCSAKTSSDGKTTTCEEYGCTSCGIDFGK